MRIPNLLSGPLPWNPSWKNCLAADKRWRRFSLAALCHRAEGRNNKLSTYIADTTLVIAQVGEFDRLLRASLITAPITHAVAGKAAPTVCAARSRKRGGRARWYPQRPRTGYRRAVIIAQPVGRSDSANETTAAPAIAAETARGKCSTIGWRTAMAMVDKPLS